MIYRAAVFQFRRIGKTAIGMSEVAQLKEAKYTVVYKDGNEIARMDGHLIVNPKDYDDKLPIEVHHITVDTVGIFRIEK